MVCLSRGQIINVGGAAILERILAAVGVEVEACHGKHPSSVSSTRDREGILLVQDHVSQRWLQTQWPFLLFWFGKR